MQAVILGAGPAGVTAAETLRSHDQDAQITVISAEPYPPYSPPAMADHFLTGSKAHFWRGENWDRDQGIQYLPQTTAVGLDTGTKQVTLSDKKALSYDQLVLATGSSLYAPLDGAELPGVNNFKSLQAAEQLITQVRKGKTKSALIVGAGFIGVEIALLLRELGLDVTLIEKLDQVMPAMLDPVTAQATLEGLQEKGIQVRLTTEATSFLGENKAEGVQLESGETLQADVYLAATGVKPNLAYLEGSPIEFHWGIRVDDQLRTSVPDVYAAGDAVEAPDLITGEAYVHAIYPNAVEQGKIVGQNLAGLGVRYAGAKRMNSLKHLGIPVAAAGLKEGDEVLTAKVNGSTRTLYLKDDRLVGFQLVGDLHPAGVFHALINRGESVKKLKHHLLNPGFGQGTIAWSAIRALS